MIAVSYVGIFVIQSSAQRQICSYYGSDRVPKEAYSLSNCTWFRERSCCTRTEVTSTFLGMPHLETSSSDCHNHLNYLMCYFCSPDQHQWFRRGKVHVCKSFCNDVYKHCKDAKFGGKALSSVYSNGNEFCKAQHFNVLDEDTQACYKFDDSLFATASLHKGCSFRVILLLVVSLIYHFLWT